MKTFYLFNRALNHRLGFPFDTRAAAERHRAYLRGQGSTVVYEVVERVEVPLPVDEDADDEDAFERDYQKNYDSYTKGDLRKW